MTMAAGTSFGTQLQFGDGGDPEAFATLSEQTTIELPEESADPIDATSHDNAAAEYIPAGVGDAGQVVAEGNYVGDTPQSDAIALLGAAAGNVQACYPDFGARTAEFTVDDATDIFTSVGHGLTTGQPLRVASSGTLPNGMASTTTYWVEVIDEDTFYLHTSNAEAVSGANAVNVGDAGAGTHTLRIGHRLDFAALVVRHGRGRAARGQAQSIRLTLKLTGAVTLTPA